MGAIIVYSGWGQSSQPDKHMQSGNHGNHAQRNLVHYRFLSRSHKSHVEIKDDSIVNFMFTVPYCSDKQWSISKWFPGSPCPDLSWESLNLMPRPHPLTRKGAWWPLSDSLVMSSQQSWYWTTQWNSALSCNHVLDWPTYFIVSCLDPILASVMLLKSHD